MLCIMWQEMTTYTWLTHQTTDAPPAHSAVYFLLDGAWLLQIMKNFEMKLNINTSPCKKHTDSKLFFLYVLISLDIFYLFKLNNLEMWRCNPLSTPCFSGVAFLNISVADLMALCSDIRSVFSRWEVSHGATCSSLLCCAANQGLGIFLMANY